MKYEKIIEYIESKNNGITINPDTDLFLNGILDSLGIIALVTLISDEYYIKFDANDLALENFKNIDSIFLLITSKS
mgnify:CR=1 FL=1